MLIEPFEADTSVISVPAVRYDVPSVRRVSDPDNPPNATDDPEIVMSPPKSDNPLSRVCFELIAPDTKRNTSEPGESALGFAP